MKNIRYFSAYEVVWVRPENESPFYHYTPKACVNSDKFFVSYEDGDYEELPMAMALNRAKDFFRSQFGCKFEGDINPATGNRVYAADSQDAPCTHICRLENTPFSLTYVTK